MEKGRMGRRRGGGGGEEAEGIGETGDIKDPTVRKKTCPLQDASVTRRVRYKNLPHSVRNLA